MASERRNVSPNPAIFNNMPDLGLTPPPPHAGGSQSGSDYNYHPGQSPSIDAMLHNGLTNGAGNLRHDVGLPTYAVGPASLPVHNYGGAYDTNASPSSLATTYQMQSYPGSASAMVEPQQALLAQHRNTSGNSDSHSSFGGASDNTSPSGSRMQNDMSAEHANDHSSRNASNDSLNVQNQTDESNRHDEAAPPPSWSELKTKAGKERKRLPLACIACRRKKIRCSGENPACKHCLRSRIPCVYKVTTRKAAPRTDYMAMLDKRLKRMEDRMIKIIPKEEQGILSSTGRANVKPPLPPAPPRNSSSTTKKRAADQAIDELEKWAKSNDTATDKLLTDDAMRQGPLKAEQMDEHTLLQEGADKLPPKDVQEHLAEVFFDYVYGQSYHLLHKPSFMRKLAQGQIAPVLLLAVCAIAARFSNHPAVRTEPAFLRGECWASAAREISLKRYDTPNLTILIVYLILTLHEFGTCQGGRSWMFGGMAQRMAFALQLHQDLEYDPKASNAQEKAQLSFTDREIRRRTMWACFLMDRFCSSGTERPTIVRTDHIRAQLPIRERYFQTEIDGPTEGLLGDVPNPASPDSGKIIEPRTNMGVAAFTVRLVAIWGELIDYHNLGGKEKEQHNIWEEESKFQAIQRQIDAWEDLLPERLKYWPENLANHATDKVANQFIFMHIIFNQIILFKNRFAIPTPGNRPSLLKDMPHEFVQECAQAGCHAANNISTLVHEGMHYAVVAPFAGYAAFFSSTVHINGAFSNKPGMEASSKQYLAWNVNYLTKMKKYWGMFHFMTENLRDLYRKSADAVRNSHSNGTGGERREDGIFQYGDWFDRYPHGVSGTDYEEPTDDVKKEPGSDAVLGQQSDLQTVEEFFARLTPPSRATNQPQQRPKKNLKKHQPKAEPKGNTASDPPKQQAQRRHTSEAAQKQTAHGRQSTGDSLTQQHIGHDNIAYQAQSTPFPSTFQQPQNALLMPNQQQLQQAGVLSFLDRQAVLSSYAGVDQTPANMGQNAMHNVNHAVASTPNLNFDYNFNGMSNIPNAHSTWGDASASTWFMPFNLDPPPIVEDNGLFTGDGIDWSTNLGDLGHLQSTGLTPRPMMELDGTQDGQDHCQMNTNMDAMDQMR